MNKLADLLHWIGFILSCFMLILSALDQSKDEVLIHIMASIIPITISWVIAYLLSGKRHFLPFIK